jgi:hypothetical protein
MRLDYHSSRQNSALADRSANAFQTDGGALSADTLQLTRGSDGDVPFVMATERLVGYEHLVGRWTEAQHRVVGIANRRICNRSRLGFVRTPYLASW